MSDDGFQLPDILDVSPETVAAAEASLDPEVKPPADARESVDKKTGDKFWYWTDNVVIEKVRRGRTKSGLTEFFVQSKVRPGVREDNKNVGKRVFSRYRVNYKVLAGQEQNAGHEIMNRLSMNSILSLLKCAGFAPKDADAGLPASLMMHLFPAETDSHDSPLVGMTFVGSISNSPNKQRDTRQNEISRWLPMPEGDE